MEVKFEQAWLIVQITDLGEHLNKKQIQGLLKLPTLEQMTSPNA
jgi:hypothetical protein